MNINLGTIIKGFAAVSITFFIVIGLIRISNNLFYVESLNPPTKEELFANIDFIDESYFSATKKGNNEINLTHTVLGNEKLANKLERQNRFVKHFKEVISAQELDIKINEEEKLLKYLTSGKTHSILKKDDLEDKYIEKLEIVESEYQGRKVKLNDPFRLPSGSKKKFGVYVKNEKGNVVKVTFGDPNMEIKRDDPGRLKSFRARHNCDNPGPKTKARYWSCFQWRKGAKVDN